MAREKKPTRKERFVAWGESHNGLMCALVFVAVSAGLTGLFLFVTFTDFGGSAEFIYNQF